MWPSLNRIGRLSKVTRLVWPQKRDVFFFFSDNDNIYIIYSTLIYRERGSKKTCVLGTSRYINLTWSRKRYGILLEFFCSRNPTDSPVATEPSSMVLKKGVSLGEYLYGRNLPMVKKPTESDTCWSCIQSKRRC